MTQILRPFSGHIPAGAFANRIVGPPVSTLSQDQIEAARIDPLSFRHVLGRGAGSSHAEAQEWVAECRNQGALVPVGPAVFVYQISKGDLVATGLIADVSIDAYDSGLIKRHEKTIAKTERKMVKYMRSTRVHGNPVGLAHRPHPGIANLVAQHVGREPDLSFVAADGVSHGMWAVEGTEATDLCASYTDILYITDGHHRMAAASSIASEESRSESHIPAGLFSTDELRLRSFARCVVDPDLDQGELIGRLEDEHQLEEVSAVEARPRGRGEFGVQIADRSFRLRLTRSGEPFDLYRSLDVNLLQDLVLEPMCGITNPRKDSKLRFVADLTSNLGKASDFDAWFVPFPTSVEDVIAVADMGLAMPPKSTWFAPKLPSGLVVRLVDRV